MLIEIIIKKEYPESFYLTSLQIIQFNKSLNEIFNRFLSFHSILHMSKFSFYHISPISILYNFLFHLRSEMRRNKRKNFKLYYMKLNNKADE